MKSKLLVIVVVAAGLLRAEARSGDLVTGTGAEGDAELVESPFCESLSGRGRILEEKGKFNRSSGAVLKVGTANVR